MILYSIPQETVESKHVGDWEVAIVKRQYNMTSEYWSYMILIHNTHLYPKQQIVVVESDISDTAEPVKAAYDRIDSSELHRILEEHNRIQSEKHHVEETEEAFRKSILELGK